MSQGLKLLMLRMESHPAEFEMNLGHLSQSEWGATPSAINSTGPGEFRGVDVSITARQLRWRWAVALLIDKEPPAGLLPPEEVRLFREKYWALQEKAFSERIVSSLMDGAKAIHDSS